MFLLVSINFSYASIFDDGNDRKFVRDLRAKDPALLGQEERAILSASNKVGLIGFCRGRGMGNAFLILHRGRPAVVTNAHLAFTPDGRSICASEAEFSQGMGYLPNFGFYDTSGNIDEKNFVLRKVELEYPPVNMENVKEPYKPDMDYLVFYLKEDITRDKMPDGSMRGYLKYSKAPPNRGSLYMLGLAGDMGGGNYLIYQARCDGFVERGSFYHACDTVSGSSASLISTLESGELRFRGLHVTGGEIKVPSLHGQRPETANMGVSSDAIRARGSEPTRRSTFIASELQGILSIAGCYEGKLDNQWGQGSRDALNAFAAAAAITLPGVEPSAELLVTIKHAAPEGAKVCRK
ncbi:MAG: hypothetical protein WBA44_10415 [Mesorhizobium sp.]